MAVDIDLVLLGNERAMEPVYDGPSPMTGLQHYRREKIDLADEAIDRLSHERQECSWDQDGNRRIPLNPYWERPGDGLYWERGSTYRSGMGDVYYGDSGLDAGSVWYAEPQDHFLDFERCQICKDRALEGRTRCKLHPWFIFDSVGRMHDYPNILASQLEKPYWEYSDEELKLISDPAVSAGNDEGPYVGWSY